MLFDEEDWIMKIGLEGDKRKFQRATKAQREEEVTKDVVDEITRWPQCIVCKMDITGKKWRVAEGKYVCFMCHNE